MAAGSNVRPSGDALDQLAREWFAEIREAQRAASTERPDGSRQDAAADFGGGLLDWLIADTSDDSGDGD